LELEEKMRPNRVCLLLFAIVLFGCRRKPSASDYAGAWVSVNRPEQRLNIRPEGSAFVVEDDGRKKYVGTLTNGILRVSGPIGSIDILYTPSTGHLIAAGDEYQRQPVAAPSAPIAPAPVASSAMFDCRPTSVRGGAKLFLTMPKSHGGELGVVTPDRGLLFVAFRPESPSCRPPITSDAFMAMERMEIDTASAVGVNSICSTEMRAVFQTAGTYEFVVSPNLETEDSGQNLRCKVAFGP
jgi:hypothetical protein